jgi:hypothetical protein
VGQRAQSSPTALVNVVNLLGHVRHLQPRAGVTLLADYLNFLESLLATAPDQQPALLTARPPRWLPAWSDSSKKAAHKMAIEQWSTAKDAQEVALIEGLPSVRHLATLSRVKRMADKHNAHRCPRVL